MRASLVAPPPVVVGTRPRGSGWVNFLMCLAWLLTVDYSAGLHDIEEPPLSELSSLRTTYVPITPQGGMEVVEVIVDVPACFVSSKHPDLYVEPERVADLVSEGDEGLWRIRVHAFLFACEDILDDLLCCCYRVRVHTVVWMVYCCAVRELA